MKVVVSGAYVVEADQSLSFVNDQEAFDLADFSHLTILGSVAVQSSLIGGASTGAFGFQNDSMTIEAGGSVTVTAASPANIGYGFYMNSGGGSFSNDGVLSVAGPSATGVFLSGDPTVFPNESSTFANTNTITVRAVYDATALFSNDTFTGSNHGFIDVTGATAEGVVLQSGGTFTNSGSITATSSGAQAYGITADNQLGGATTIINSGTITGVDAVRYSYGVGYVLLHNSGILNGDVLLNSVSGNEVHNTGAIHGAVTFLGSSGSELFDGRGGTVSGPITLGTAGSGGSAVVYLGDDGETVHGGTGSTLVVGGAGNDIVDGGMGPSTISFAAAAAAVTVSLALQGAAQDTVGAGHDTLTNFVNLTGSAFSDHLTGDANDNVIDGGSGGNDVLNGGGGRNTVSFASSTTGVNVSLALNSPQDIGGGRTETLSNFWNLTGSAFNDVLVGDAGSSTINGGAGDDLIKVGSGNTADGGSGINTISFAAITTGLQIRADSATALSNAAPVAAFTNFQRFVGTAYNDIFTPDPTVNAHYDGGGGTNTLDLTTLAVDIHTGVSSWPTTVDFGAGTITNGFGTSTFTNFTNLSVQSGSTIILDSHDHFLRLSGSAANLIIETSNATHNVIYNFAIQVDQIDLSALSNFSNLAQVEAAATQVGADTVIALPNGGSIELQNVQMTSLVAADFIFMPTATASPQGGSLDAGTGSKVLVGGGASDAFTFAPGIGQDVVTNFSHAQGDQIDLSAYGSFGPNGSLSALLASTSQVGADTVISLPGGGSVTLQGVQKATLTAGDFAFHTGISDVNASNVSLNGAGNGSLLFRDKAGDWGYESIDAAGNVGWHGLGGTNALLSVVGQGDFNGDGVGDVLFRDNHTGSFGYTGLTAAGGQSWHGLGGSSAAMSVVATGDFNGDGVADILFRNDITGDIGYVSLDKAGNEGWRGLGGSSPTMTVVGTGDFNGDGVADVMFRDNHTGDFGYIGLTASGEGWQGLGGSSPTMSVAAIGDFNGDGVSDVLFRDTATGALGYVWLDRAGHEGWQDLGGSSTTMSVVGAGDFNGDKISDILFRNNATGDIGYMGVDAAHHPSWHSLGGSSTAMWVV